MIYYTNSNPHEPRQLNHVEKSIYIEVEFPKQVHSSEERKSYRFTFTRIYNTAIEEVPSTDDFIRMIKRDYSNDLTAKIDGAVKDFCKETGCPEDIVGYSVSFLLPPMYLTKG